MWIKKHYDEAEGRRKLRFSKPLWGASLLAAAVLALGVNGTLSQFIAQITNPNNHVSTTSFAFSETLVDPTTNEPLGTPCAVAGAGEQEDCTSINKYGNGGAAATPMAPGDSRSTTVQLTNESQLPGGLAGNLTLEVGPCGNGNNPPAAGRTPGDLCNALRVTLTCGSNTIIGPPGVSLTAFPANSPYTIATLQPEGSVRCTFTVTFPASTTFPPELQNVETSQVLNWVFTSA